MVELSEMSGSLPQAEVTETVAKTKAAMRAKILRRTSLIRDFSQAWKRSGTYSRKVNYSSRLMMAGEAMKPAMDMVGLHGGPFRLPLEDLTDREKQ